jgi:hypothetical protein
MAILSSTINITADREILRKSRDTCQSFKNDEKSVKSWWWSLEIDAPDPVELA